MVFHVVLSSKLDMFCSLYSHAISKFCFILTTNSLKHFSTIKVPFFFLCFICYVGSDRSGLLTLTDPLFLSQPPYYVVYPLDIFTRPPELSQVIYGVGSTT